MTAETEDDGFITVHPQAAHPQAERAPTHVSDAAKAVALRTLLERIRRKTEIMVLDARRGTPARQDAEEIRLLAGMALRCLGDADA